MSFEKQSQLQTPFDKFLEDPRIAAKAERLRPYIYALMGTAEEGIIEDLIRNPRSITTMENPSSAAKFLAVASDPHIVLEISDPYEDEALINFALSLNGSLLSHLSEATQAQKFFVLSRDAMGLSYLEHPTEEDQIVAAMHFPQALRQVENPSEAAQKLANIRRKLDRLGLLK